MDEKLFHLINERWTHPALDLFMAVISRADIWMPFFVVIAVALLVFDGFRGRAFVFCTLLVLGLSNLLVDPIKTAVGRPRPKQIGTVRMIELQKTRPMIRTIFRKPRIRTSNESERERSGSSFPSGHTNNNTVIAICATLFYRRWGKWYWVITAAVAYSRVYLAAHWPSDVVATFFMAAGETLVLLGLCELIWQKVIVRRRPNVGARHPQLMSALAHEN